jgi:NDP-4-keto-2,6-dideoxyhexose 3-C-methyltransferase
MEELLTLGNLYPSDFLDSNSGTTNNQVELKLILTDDNFIRLEKVAPFSQMYGKYWYRSGMNRTMKKELQDIVHSILEIKKLKENDLWIDIACNDGTMFDFIPKNVIKIGIDPADDTYKQESEKKSNLIIQDFFSYDVFKKSKYGNQKAKVITTVAMFYDLDEPKKFLIDLKKILSDDGLWVLQLSYTPLMIKQLAFDNICHEHVYYYSLSDLKRLLDECGFKIMDCQLNSTNGGSFRLYVMKSESSENYFASQPYRDVANIRISSLLELEEKMKIHDKSTWSNFFDRINFLKRTTVDFIKKEKEKGKKIWGYGASTKGNTLLQYFGLDNNLITGIADRNISKWGKKTIGTNIPIYSEEQMRTEKPDYLLVLPWQFIDEFKDREKDFLIDGGKFIVPCPKFEII